MPLGIARHQAELGDQILDVVEDEGEAAVELVEAAGVGERLLAARLGDIGGGLDAGGAEQVEILPVQPAADGGMFEDDEAGEPPSWLSGTPAQARSMAASQAGTGTSCAPSASQPSRTAANSTT